MIGVHVFKTAELFEHILCHADRLTLARCARVCKLWSEPALDVLWRGLIDIKKFMEVLCPRVCDALFKHH